MKSLRALSAERALLAAGLALLAACGTGPLSQRSDEEQARQLERALAYQKASAVKGRQNWERALATGATYFTIHDDDGRTVVTDVELRADQVCMRVVASRVAAAALDYWVNYDQPDASQPALGCDRYADIHIRPGDERKR